MKVLAAVFTLALLSACRESDVNVNVQVDSSAVPPQQAPASPPPAGETPPPADTSGQTPNTRWTVSAQGAGPVTVGMAGAAAERALGPVEQYPPIEGSPCRYLNPKGKPDGVSFMVIDNVVARLDVSRYDGPKEVPADLLPRTAAGVGVGSTKADVQAAYGARLQVRPHEYVTGGQYLFVTPPADTTRRIVFETDERGRVTGIRAGRRPEVEWVEGCS